MYSDFVLTSIGTPFYYTIKADVFKYSMYVWAAGDFIEELIACFVSICIMFLLQCLHFEI